MKAMQIKEKQFGNLVSGGAERTPDKMSTLTTYQKQLMAELTEIYELVQFDFYGIEEYPEDWRSTLLELMRREVIRSRVVTVYTRVDEYLCSELCMHFFGSGDFHELWKTEKFQLFNYQFQWK
jgi:hypothetical protein